MQYVRRIPAESNAGDVYLGAGTGDADQEPRNPGIQEPRGVEMVGVGIAQVYSIGA